MARKTIDPKIRAEAIARKLAGEKTGIIAGDYGVDATTVRQWCKDAGVVVRVRASRPMDQDEDDTDALGGEFPSGSRGALVIGGALLVGTIIAIVAAAKSNPGIYGAIDPTPPSDVIPEFNPRIIPEFYGAPGVREAECPAT